MKTIPIARSTILKWKALKATNNFLIEVSAPCKGMTHTCNSSNCIFVTMNMRRLTPLFILFILLSSQLKSQVTGRILDKQTGAVLPFVHVINLTTSVGTTSDIDGKFRIPAQGEDVLRFSFVGYESLDQRVLLREEMTIYLTEQTVALGEAVILPGINPAHRIIQRAIDQKDVNNPERNIGYRCDAYNKLILTAEPDSVLLKDDTKMAELDSSDIRALDFFEGQHLLVMESITERRFDPPGKHHERIKASRMSGLQSPDFALLATQIQSFSFYEEQIQVLSSNYLSPISNNAIRKYTYELKDTVVTGLDSVFVIAFQPGYKRNFEGLKGLLYIHTNGYAIEHVIAQPADTSASIQIEIKQKYQRIDDRKWFPVQLSSKMLFEDAVANGFPIIGLGKSYLKNVQLDPEFNRKDFSQVLIQMDPMSTRQPEDFWNTYRPDSLDQRELRTYEFMDSVGKAEKFDTKIKIVEALFDGKWRLGMVDLDLNRLLAYNNYEGLRLGAGMHTNNRLSSWVSVGGYGAYGFKDEMFKYGGDVTFTLSQMTDSYFKWSSSVDVRERGASPYHFGTAWMAEDLWYELFITKMDQLVTHQLEFHSQLPWYFRLNAGLRQRQWKIPDDYRFQVDASELVTLKPNTWATTSAFAQLRFAFKERYIQTMRKRRSLGTKWPVLKVGYEQGLADLFSGELAYSKWTAQLDFKKALPLAGVFQIRLDAGRVDRPLPAFLLFNFKGSKADFSLVTPFAFETMDPGSFMANEFATLTIRHDFKDFLLKTPKFAPHFVLVHNMGWGTLQDPELHVNGDFGSLENGYVESGLEIRNLLRSNFTGLGVGFFHRYGAASTGSFKEDASIKLSSTFVF